MKWGLLRLCLVGILLLLSVAVGQKKKKQKQQHHEEGYELTRQAEDIMFCVLSEEELAKCQAFADATARDHLRNEATFGSYYRPILCKQYTSHDECMRVIDENSLQHPNIMTVDAGEVFVGGRYHSLVPIIKEVYENGRDFYHAVAVVKKGTMEHVQSFEDLRGAKACFAKVGSLAGWTIPIHRLFKSGVMDVVDCNNHVKSAIEFFGTSCAVNSLQDRYNPLGDNPHKFCELCGSDTPGVRCTNRDPYAEYSGAFMCLKEKGDIAFLNEKTVFRNAENPDDFELLCPVEDGPNGALERKPVLEYEKCSWGVAPGRAVVVSSAMDMPERLGLQSFLQSAFKKYGGFTTPGEVEEEEVPEEENEIEEGEEEEEEVYIKFKLFESYPRYGMLKNLLFDDDTKSFGEIEPDKMSYKDYLGRSFGGSFVTPNEAIDGIRQCPVGQMTLCVISEAEMRKCVRMRTALNAQLLSPKMSCKRTESHLECMRAIRHGEADITVLDAGDVYRAGFLFGLIPIMAEVYNLEGPYYYAVAVTKQRDNSSELIYLKTKNTCHTAVGHAAGWIIPLAWLITNERIRDYGCDAERAAAEYFSKACAPGAQSTHFQMREQENYWEYSHLCDLCHGTAGSYCHRNQMEDYYGHTGAFRCLVEGGGNVAFIKHTTVMENCDGKRKEWWARNQLTTDYELLCRDGTRAPARDYKRCYLGQVKSNAIVTSPQVGYEKLNAFINLLKYAQQFYGQKVPDEFSFSMFYSEPPYADLIFQDATQQLIVLPEEEWHYTKYLDKEFLKAYAVVECRSGAISITSALTLTLTVTILTSLISNLYFSS